MVGLGHVPGYGPPAGNKLYHCYFLVIYNYARGKLCLLANHPLVLGIAYVGDQTPNH